MISKKEEKIIELYSESKLPKNGWIQGCINCEMKTSKVQEYKKIENLISIFIYKIYLCKDCKKENISKNENFIKYVEKKIKYVEKKIKNPELGL